MILGIDLYNEIYNNMSSLSYNKNSKFINLQRKSLKYILILICNWLLIRNQYKLLSFLALLQRGAFFPKPESIAKISLPQSFWDLTGMPRQFSGHKLELNRREKKINNMLDLDFMTPIFIFWWAKSRYTLMGQVQVHYQWVSSLGLNWTHLPFWA